MGDPSYLGVDVAVADSELGRPLLIVRRRGELEFGQVEEVGAVVGRSDVEEGRLPVLAGLDDGRRFVSLLAGVEDATAAVDHRSPMDLRLSSPSGFGRTFPVRAM